LDTPLRHDALKNCLIAYKKAESWPEVIGVGRKFLQVCADEERPEAAFEIGYAHLRSGNFRKSIGFFRTAVRADPKPEYHYWLAETYLGRGDFTRALYHYQAIVNKFSKDEMWGPTAEFKSGLALEFLDAIAEAKKLYEGIVKRRGAGDVWGAEAVKRLELLK
jgi:TolA-binding protein